MPESFQTSVLDAIFTKDTRNSQNPYPKKIRHITLLIVSQHDSSGKNLKSQPKSNHNVKDTATTMTKRLQRIAIK
jgi:hypothetical protein